MKTLIVLALTVPLFASVATRTERGLVYVTPEKQVEAMEFQVNGTQPYRQWAIHMDRPLIGAGEEYPVTLHGTAMFVLSVAYSDGSYDGGMGSTRLVAFRNSLINGEVLHPELCNCGAAALLLIKEAQRKGRPVKLAKAHPDTFPWWWAGSMTIIATIDGVPEANGVDWAGNPDNFGGCFGPCTITTSAKASCPPAWPRAFINAWAGMSETCETTTMNMGTQALYGPTGTGGTASQRFGIHAYSEIDGLPQGPVVFATADSCSFTQPEVLSPGGGGPCN